MHGPIEFDTANIFSLTSWPHHPALGRLSDLSPGPSWQTMAMKMTHVAAATTTSRTRQSTCCCMRRSAPVPLFAHVPLILGTDNSA